MRAIRRRSAQTLRARPGMRASPSVPTRAIPTAKASAGASGASRPPRSRTLILEQVAGLRDLAEPRRAWRSASSSRTAPSTTRPSGRPRWREGVLRGGLALGLPLLGQPGTLLESLAGEARASGSSPRASPIVAIGTTARWFPAASPGPCSTTWPRSRPQVVRLVAEGRVATLCIHGDEPAAVANADRIRSILSKSGIAITSFLD